MNIALNPVDQHRILFRWYNNVSRGDFSIIGYKTLRLAFGLRCSPTLLMLAMHRILMIDVDGDSFELHSLKRLIYSCIYVDYGAVVSSDPEYLRWTFEKLSKIFNHYMFYLKQYYTNPVPLQDYIESR